MIRNRCTSVLFGLAVAVPAVANAETTHADVQRLLLRDGNNAGRTRKGEDGRERALQQRGAGAEQVQIAQLANNELMMFGIGSYELNGEPAYHRLQMFCASVTLDAMRGPQMQTLKYVTRNRADRYRNGMHPRVTPIFGGEVVAVTYNIAQKPNGEPDNHARAYTQVFGPNCTPVSEPVQIMYKNNDNCSENKGEGVVVEQTASDARILEMHGCNGNGSDDAWVAGVRITKQGTGSYTVQKEYDLVVENDEERSRGTVLLTGDPNFALACFTAGNTQPPNKGVRCAGINTARQAPPDANGNTGEEGGRQQGRLMWRKYIQQREGRTYRTEVRVASILGPDGKPTNKVYAVYQKGERRRREGKGSQTMVTAVLQAGPNGMEIVGAPQEGVAPGADATHGQVCSTLWGTDGQASSKAFVMTGSHNGEPGALSVAHILGESNNAMKTERRVGLGASIDVSWIPNIYGNNPNMQGRNYMHCVGNVRNPGYGVPGGYLSDVKSFVAIPATTRRQNEAVTPVTRNNEDKLALELILVPAVISGNTVGAGAVTAPRSSDTTLANTAR